MSKAFRLKRIIDDLNIISEDDNNFVNSFANALINGTTSQLMDELIIQEKLSGVPCYDTDHEQEYRMYAPDNNNNLVRQIKTLRSASRNDVNNTIVSLYSAKKATETFRFSFIDAYILCMELEKSGVGTQPLGWYDLRKDYVLMTHAQK